MVSKLAYLPQIVCHSRHDFTRFVIVIEAVGKLFQMIEHIASHISLHFNADNMTLVLYKIVKQRPDNI